MHATEKATPESPLRGFHGALLLLVLCFPMAFVCDNPPEPSKELKALRVYTKACLENIHLDPAKDLIGPWDCQDTKKARRLELHVGNKRWDFPCSGAHCPKEGDRLPSKCDYPAWLDGNCYGNSYIQKLKTPNPKVEAVLLCRHKKKLTNKSNNFDDIAIIAHNSGNGETCWLQAEQFGKLNGKAVYGPMSRDVKNDFWLDPETTKRVHCVKCHDNGPWMNSRWMSRSKINLSDGATGLYKNSTPPFDAWPQPVFVELNDAKLDDDKECTTCHRIAAGLKNVDKTTTRSGRPPLGGRDFNTCKTWIKLTTGTPHGAATSVGKSDEVKYWMPDYGSSYGKDEWEKDYRKHVKKLLECCEEMGKKKSKPALAATIPAGCVEKAMTWKCPVPEVGGTCPVKPGS